MKIKNLLSLLFVCITICTYGVINTSAATYGYWTYNVSNGKATITEFETYAMGEIEIPVNLGGYPVTSIGSGAFKWCASLTSITIPDSVKSIGDDAFRNCTSLKSITIPDSVTSIGAGAFNGCLRLKSITIPDSVTSIGASTFLGCTSLTSITIGNGVRNIGEDAFRGCTSLTSITIPDSVKSIGNSAFYDCKSLTSITIGNSVTSIGYYAFRGCTSLTSITIPDSVKSIGDDAFRDCKSLTSITIGNGVTSIGSNAFYGCSNLKSVDISNISVWCKIEFGDFDSNPLYYANNLYLNGNLVENLIIPDDVTSIGDYAFYDYDSLASITIGNGVTSIGYDAFVWCSGLKSITLGNSVTSIGIGAFRGCTSLTSITIPDSVKSIGNSAFRDCTSLKSITIPDSVKSIGNGAFYDCDSLASITIGNGVTSIGYNAFYNTRAYHDGRNWKNGVLYIGSWLIEAETSINGKYNIENRTISIADYAFEDCTSLTSITIPDNVSNIGDYAFYNCSQLGQVYISDISAWCEIEFGNCYSNPLYFANCLYLNGNLVENLIIPDGVTSIGDCAFCYYQSLTSITIPDSVTSIGSSAFDYCSCLESVIIGNGVTSIGDYAFEGCTSLTSITIPGSVTSIGDSAFNCCENLTSITIPGSVTTIGDSAFAGCDSLESVIIPDSVTSIGEWAFSGCNSLESVIIPDSVTSIGDSAFHYCRNLTSITIPDSVTTIGEWTFCGCYRLESVTIPGSVTSIGEGAFYNCENLTSITIPDSVTTIGAEAFISCKSLTTIYYNGLKERYDSISIGLDNSYFENAEKVYFAYITLLNTDENEYFVFKQNIGKSIDLSSVPIPQGYNLKVYQDKELTKEYSLNSPVNENQTLYVSLLVKKYDVKFIGDYEGKQTIMDGDMVTLPTEPEGYVYSYYVNGELWNNEAITEDITITVKKLCDKTELEITNLSEVVVSAMTICGKNYDRTFIPAVVISENAEYAIYTDRYCNNKISKVLLNSGKNTFYIKVTAESGRSAIYTIIVNRDIPTSLGKLTVLNTNGGNIEFSTENIISGNPIITICYGNSLDNLSHSKIAGFNADAQTIYVSGLPEGSEFYFKAVADYGDVIAESSVVLEKTGITLSGECYILQTITPPGGTITEGENGGIGSISDLRVTNKYSSISVDVLVSAGASWNLYKTATATKPIENNNMTLIAGRNNNAYIRVVSEDGQNTNTYLISIYRQSKSSIPAITESNGVITISAAEGSKVLYTTDGSIPNEQNGTLYTTSFTAVPGMKVNAIAKQEGKDEYSDVVTFIVPEKPSVTISEIHLYNSADNMYDYEFYIEAPEIITGKFIVAAYSNEKFVGIDSQDISLSENSVYGSLYASEKPDSYKVFIWSDLSTLLPICETVSGTIN